MAYSGRLSRSRIALKLPTIVQMFGIFYGGTLTKFLNTLERSAHHGSLLTREEIWDPGYCIGNLRSVDGLVFLRWDLGRGSPLVTKYHLKHLFVKTCLSGSAMVGYLWSPGCSPLIGTTQTYSDCYEPRLKIRYMFYNLVCAARKTDEPHS